MRQPSPPLNDADAVDYPVLDVFVPDAGDPQGTAVVLTGMARDNNLSPRHVRADLARGGYWISNALADVVYDEPAEEAEPETPAKAPAKTGSTSKKKGT